MQAQQLLGAQRQRGVKAPVFVLKINLTRAVTQHPRNLAYLSALQIVGGQILSQGNIVRNLDGYGHVAFSFPGQCSNEYRGLPYTSTGMMKAKVLPLPNPLCTLISPPSSSTSRRVMCRPSPQPACSRTS